MAMVLVRANVAYPKEAVDRLKESESDMQNAGMKAASVTGLAEQRNILYVMFTWDSVSSARSYWASSVGKSVLEKLNSVEEPEVLVLEQPVEL